MDAEQRSLIESIVRESSQRPGPLLVVLHAIQQQLGHVPPGAVPSIAELLNLSIAEVHGVITFYHHFRQAPPGACIVELCRAEACLSMGAEALAQRVRDRLGIDFNETTRDGRFSLLPVYCLGNCASAPTARVGEELVGRATLERIEDRLAMQPVST